MRQAGGLEAMAIRQGSHHLYGRTDYIIYAAFLLIATHFQEMAAKNAPSCKLGPF